MSITLRDANEEDESFLIEVYGSTRAAELAVVPWDAEQKLAFVSSQFHAQHTYYHEQFPDADYKIILDDGDRVGRVYVQRDESIRIMDITVLPQYRKKGIGTLLIQQLLAEGVESGKAVRIWIENFNPSMALFERLGFASIQEEGFNHLLEWNPPLQSSSPQ